MTQTKSPDIAGDFVYIFYSEDLLHAKKDILPSALCFIPAPPCP